MKMKNCELCKGLARMHCESDRASLCWSCDYKVHSANFLVARHTRTLLCHVCQSPTPWTAAGLKLGPTVSVCSSCFENYNKINVDQQSEATNEDETETELGNFDDDDDEEGDDDDEDEEYDDEEATDFEDNQVVPWSPSTPPPPSAADSPSNSDEESSTSSTCDRRDSQRKRALENADRSYNVSSVSRTSQGNAGTVAVSAAAVRDGYRAGEGRINSVDSLSTIAEDSLKKRRTGTGRYGIPGSKSWAVVESVKRLHQEKMSSSAAIAELRRLNEDPSAADFNTSESSYP